ncbi:hypothetical protein E4T47_02556 [Aureobasidium subglaciale]|nr:hypothetical protein E4T47_02556 [Aureobasidium subglaciale]
MFLKKFPEFKSRELDEDGDPGSGRYHEMWNNVLNIITEIKTSTEEDMEYFRNWIQTTVDRAGYIDSAVCLALGPYDGRNEEYQETFMHQLAMFIVIRDMLEAKQGNAIPMVFQDPLFHTAEEYLLSYLAGGKVVEHPGCLKHMTETSFVLAIHLPWWVYADTVMISRPALYIGGRIDNSGAGPGLALAMQYIRQVYMSGQGHLSEDMREMIDQADEFRDYYEVIEFDKTYDSIHEEAMGNNFDNTFVHLPKVEHPGSVSSNTDSSETELPGPDRNKTSSGGSGDSHGEGSGGGISSGHSTVKSIDTGSASTIPTRSKNERTTMQSVSTEPIAAPARPYLADNSLWGRRNSTASATSTTSRIPMPLRSRFPDQAREHEPEEQKPQNRSRRTALIKL